MKKVFWISQITFTAILLLIACQKDSPLGNKEDQYPPWPAVKTLESTNVDSTTAKLNGTVNGYGLSTMVIFEYGTTTDYGSTVTAFQSPVTGDSITHVSAGISRLTPCMTYHYRLKAENSKWLNFYSSDSTFISGHIPTLTTISISEITDTTAVSGGNIIYDGCTAFAARGVEWSTSYNTWTCKKQPCPIFGHTHDGTGTESFTSNLTGLQPSRTYYVRAYATFNSARGPMTAHGNVISFTTSP
jgi:hypothetical protein